MHPLSSSTSSSDPAQPRGRSGLALFAWAAAWLVALDILINLVFPYPDDPRDTSPGAVALYFDYGRSMEGRLRRATREDREETAPITLAGWYDPLVVDTYPGQPDGARVTVYGMSHAMRLADAFRQVAPDYTVRTVGAPGATTNWAYGAFLRDEGKREGDFAVLAIMASNLPMIVSSAPMNWNPSFALPYTADRFYLQDGELRRDTPPYASFEGYVRTLNDPVEWDSALSWFEKNDPYFESIRIRQTWLDNSAIFRLIRRGWMQREDRMRGSSVISAVAHDPEAEAIRVANAIILDFAEKARAEGIIPVVYIVDSFGYGDQMPRALQDTLARKRILYLASHELVDPTDASGYLPDSHFTDNNDMVLARGLKQIRLSIRTEIWLLKIETLFRDVGRDKSGQRLEDSLCLIRIHSQTLLRAPPPSRRCALR